MTVIGEQSSRDALLSDMSVFIFSFCALFFWLLCFRLICEAPCLSLVYFALNKYSTLEQEGHAISCNNMQAVVIVIESINIKQIIKNTLMLP